jgi:hypothetical protein
VGIDLPVIMHKDPIPSVDHLPGHLNIPGLIRIPEVPAVQIKKEKDQTKSNQNSNLSPFLRINFRKLFLHYFSFTGKKLSYIKPPILLFQPSNSLMK